MKNYKFFIQVIFFIVSVFACFIFFREYDFSTIKQLPLITVFILLFIRILNFGVYQLSSYYLYTSFNEKITLSNLILINNCSTVSNYTTPVKIGFPIQAFLLKKIFNISYNKSAIIILTSLFVSIVTASILSIISIFFLPSINNNSIDLLIKIFIMFGFVLSVLVMIYFIKNKNLSKIGNYPIVKKINELINYLRKVNFLKLGLSWILALMSFFINAIMLKIIITSLNENADISLLFIIQGLPYLLGMLSMIPLGLGVKDATLSYLLSQFGITPEVAIISSVILRIFMSGFSILMGIFSANYLLKKNVSLLAEFKKMRSK
jgi:uncharacterized protein (TIRG00374 family)